MTKWERPSMNDQAVRIAKLKKRLAFQKKERQENKRESSDQESENDTNQGK